MGTAVVTLPDGKHARVTFDTPEQLDSTVNDLVAHHAKPDAGGFDGDPVSRSLGEAGVSAVTGAASAIAGGGAGIGRGLGAAAGALATGGGAGKAFDAFTEEANQTIENVEQAGTYQPRTKAGQVATKAVSFPFELLAQGADAAGDITSRGVKRGAELLGASPDTARRLGAGAGSIVNTSLQAAPALVLPGARALLRRKGARPPAPTPGAPPAELTATGAPRTPPSDVGGGQMPPAGGTPPQTNAGGPGAAPSQSPPPGTGPSGSPRAGAQAPAGAPPAGGAPPTDPLEERARSYASRIGLDWSRLGAGTRKALTTIAQDATALDHLNPAAVRRQAHLQSLRIPVQATRGQLERDPVQLRREAIASNLTEGQPIRDIDVAANRDLQANLEVLRGRVAGRRGTFEEPVNEEGLPNPRSIRGPTKTPTEVGEANQRVAREKAKWSKKGYQALYKIARETEPDAKAGFGPVRELLDSNPDIQHLGWVKSWIGKAESTLKPGVDAEGNPVAPKLEQVTLRELHDLREQANKHIAAGGTDGFFAKEVKNAIDQAMQDVPEGAKAWKAANDAFRKHQQEFKDQGVVAKLVNQKKGGADRALALEKTWKTIASGSVEQIRQIKKTLLTGGTPQLRMAGRRAWRDLRAETVNRILEDARNVTSADETERAILTEAALRRSINRIPRENLEEILGKQNVRELFDILRARRITTRSPVGGRTTQSGTVPNALTLFEKALKHVPGVKYAVGAKHAVQELGQRGAASRAIKDATISPLEQSVLDVERASRKNATRKALEDLERGGPTLPPGPPPQPLPIGEALKRQP